MNRILKKSLIFMLIIIMLSTDLSTNVYAITNTAVKAQSEWNYADSYSTSSMQNIIRGVDNYGNTIWTYATGYYSDYSDCEYRVHNEKVYIFDGTKLVVLSMSSGTQLYKVYNLPSGVALTEFDKEGNLYVVAADETNVYKVSAGGVLMWTSRNEWIDYYRPYDIEVKGSNLYIYNYWASGGYSQDVCEILSTVDGSTIDYKDINLYIAANQTRYIDIDNKEGNEKIYVKAIERKDYMYNCSLYINDKKVKTIKGVQDISCSVIDIQSNKKGKEIVLSGITGGNYIDNTFGIYKYKKGRLKKLGGYKYGYFNVVYAPRINTDGNGIVAIQSEASLDAGIGSYTQELNLKLVKGKLKKTKKKELKIAYPMELDINKNTKVYQKANKKSTVKKTLQYGDRVNILKLKFVKMKKTGEKYMPYKPKIVYAYIQDASGNKGWIRIKSDSFQEVIYAG